ncbi:MAG: hydrolase [Syntrophales bacterium]|jgi:nicotinamidase-related amidase
MVKADQATLVVVDIQGKLSQLMVEREALFSNAAKIIQGARVFGLPILVTEQTPEKLGPTIPELVPLLEGIQPIWKETFSCMATPLFREELAATGRSTVLLTGIETHVCVYQTLEDLLEAGFQVQVVADCVSSRTLRNRDLALMRMEKEGAALTTAEMILFELLHTAADKNAKEIFKIVK